jgi:hypothetical protein
MPADPSSGWKWTVINDAMHMTHNFDVIHTPGRSDQLLVAGKEGVIRVGPDYEQNRAIIVGGPDTLKPGVKPVPAPVWVDPSFAGAGEVRLGNLPQAANKFIATVEPMHGSQLVVYSGLPLAGIQVRPRLVLTGKLSEGHGLACGDLLRVGSDQIVVGWRGNPGTPGSPTGIAVWTPLDAQGEKWRETNIDATGMACEDLQLADLNGDGKLDIVASGRATKNVKIYFNETGR